MKISKKALERLRSIEQMLEKHLPGQHNQMSHGRGGSAPDTGGDAGGGSVSKQKFDVDEWKKKDDPRGDWEKMPVRDRDRMADAGRSVNARRDELLGDLPSRQNTGDAKDDVAARMSQMKDRIGSEELGMIEQTTKNYADALVAAGADPASAYKLTMEATDMLAAQEIEAMGRTLGDHGIRHIQGNIGIAKAIMDSAPSGLTAKDKAVAMTAMIFHDSGYLTPPSQNFLDEGHPRWSVQHYDKNLRGTVEKALGDRAAGEVGHIIRTHDATDLDWTNDPVASACRVADNMALFSKEKLPATFKQVPENTQVLKDFAAKKLTVEQARQKMKDNIDGSDLPSKVKERLKRGAEEVSKYTPKFTLGMLGGEIAGVAWKGDHPTVKLRESKEVTELNKLGDFGQKQFSKWAKTYGYPEDHFKTSLKFELKDPRGRTLLESEVERIKRILRMMVKAAERMRRQKNAFSKNKEMR